MRRALLPLSLVLMLLTGLLPVRPQVFLPHRHAVAPPPASGPTAPLQSDLVVWLKPESLASQTNNAPIGTWADSSPLHLTNSFSSQGVTSNQPIVNLNALNGYAAAKFTAASLQMLIADGGTHTWPTTDPDHGSSYPGYQVFVVCKVNATNVQQGLFTFAGSAGTMWPYQSGGIYPFFFTSDAWFNRTPDVLVPSTTWHWMSMSQGTNKLCLTYIKGSPVYTNSNSAFVYAPNSGYCKFGNSYASSTPGPYLDGYIAEVLVYDRVLTGAEDATVDTYLQTKFGL